MSEARVFIMYAEVDHIACERVAACLHDAGADVWHAPCEPSNSLTDDAVRDAELRSHPIVVVLLSEAAYETPQIARECRLAVMLAQEQPQRRIVPLVVHPTHYVGTWEFLDGIPRLHLYEIPAPLLAERILTPPAVDTDAPPPDLPLEDDMEKGLTTARLYRGLARAEAHNVIPAPELGSGGHFTRELVSALRRARAKAEDRRYPLVEPRHLLFGLVSCSTAGALEVIAACGAQPPKILTKLHKTLPWSTHPLRTAVQFSPRSKEVIQLAAVEANVLEHGYIGTVQVLLGILAEDGAAAKLLKSYDITREDARVVAARLLRGRTSA